MSAITTALDRRNFLKTSLAGATGLIVGFYLPGRREVLAAEATPAVLNAFVHVSPENVVTILIGKSEMGQGVITSLSMLAAEELECDWKRIRFEFAPAATVYFDPAFHMQGTGGSQTIHSGWVPMRQAGAAAREMLIAAAAQKWGVDASECHAEMGEVVHTSSKRRLSYGSVAEAAAKIAAADGCKTEGSKPIQGDWKADEAPRHGGQGQRQGRIWNRRAPSRACSTLPCCAAPFLAAKSLVSTRRKPKPCRA